MDLINKKLVVSHKGGISKDKALEFIAKTLADEHKVDFEKVVKGLQKRESEMTTGLENGIAIPHTVVKGLKEPKVIVSRFEKGIKWDSLDGQDIDTAVAIFVPEGARDEHLVLLGKISTIFGSKADQNKFKKMTDDEIVKKINSLEVKKQKAFNGKYDIVGITSCPTGVAHTFMAAEMLEEEARSRGLTIKIEKQGQSTVDPLTQAEIDGAKYVIFAVGKGIDETRFGGKEVMRAPVSAPIKNAKKVIDDLIGDGKKEIIKSTVTSTGTGTRVSLESTMDFNNFGSRCWNGVLAGVSYMLPFVVVGGILIALSFLIDIQNAGADNYGSASPFAAWVNSFGSVAFGMMVPILTAFMMYSIVGRQGILVGIVIGYLAIGSGPSWIDSFHYDGWMPAGAGGVAASGFIGGIFGGIMACAIIIVLDQFYDKILPSSLNGAKLILILPFTAVIIAGPIFWLINVPLTFVSWGIMWFLSLFDSPATIWIFGIFAGAMACVDYGGPVNKAAYLFGVSTLSLAGPEGSVYMAAVSAACILPPLGIALATCFGRGTLWDDNDVAAGYTNWILGSTHITEGAIPFATKYPKDVYVQTMICGSLVAALSGILGIATMAPHGGVLTFALLRCTYFDGATMQIVGGITLYVLILAIGVCLQAFLIVMSRKRTIRKEAEANLA